MAKPKAPGRSTPSSSWRVIRDGDSYWAVDADGKPASRDPLVCRIHGDELTATGWCPTGEGYWGARCRLACPGCGGSLDWSGFCGSCTPRTHRFPGPCHEQVLDRSDLGWMHYRVVISAGQPVVSEAELAAGFAEIRHRLATAKCGCPKHRGQAGRSPLLDARPRGGAVLMRATMPPAVRHAAVAASLTHGPVYAPTNRVQPSQDDGAATIPCPGCGHLVRRRRTWQRFCSHACRQRAWFDKT